ARRALSHGDRAAPRPGAVARGVRETARRHGRHVRRPAIPRGARVPQAFRRQGLGRRIRWRVTTTTFSPAPCRVPAPDRAHRSARAKTLAELVDKTLAGRTPPAMSADDRALLEVATVIRSASGDVELSTAARRSAVEDALRQAVGGGRGSAGVTSLALGRARRW